MELIREFKISEVKITNISNAPIQITLDGNLGIDKNSVLVMNREISDEYKIPITRDLVGRIIICTFSSKKLHLEQDGSWEERVKTEELEKNDLLVRSLEKKEIRIPFLSLLPPFVHLTVLRILELSSFVKGDGVHPTSSSVPFYYFYLELKEPDYEYCKKLLSPATAFKVDFSLKP